LFWGDYMKKYEFVNIMKFFAVFLVLNSHYDNLYPISRLATGGALGNSLFFASSGFLLANIERPFAKWIKKRISRLYITTWIFTIFNMVITRDLPTGISGFANLFIWPTYYWFVGALVIFYPLFYFIVKKELRKNMKWICTILLILYVVYYVAILDTSEWVIEASGLTSKDGLFKLIYYFIIMIIGAWFRVSNLDFNKIKAKTCLLLAILSVVLMYLEKAAMEKFKIFMHLQFLNQLSVLFFIITFMAFLLKKENIIQICSKKKGYSIIKFISDNTLEIYLVQFLIIDECNIINFPFNVVLITSIIFVSAKVLKAISNNFMKLVTFTNER